MDPQRNPHTKTRRGGGGDGDGSAPGADAGADADALAANRSASAAAAAASDHPSSAVPRRLRGIDLAVDVAVAPCPRSSHHDPRDVSRVALLERAVQDAETRAR